MKKYARVIWKSETDVMIVLADMSAMVAFGSHWDGVSVYLARPCQVRRSMRLSPVAKKGKLAAEKEGLKRSNRSDLVSNKGM